MDWVGGLCVNIVERLNTPACILYTDITKLFREILPLVLDSSSGLDEDVIVPDRKLASDNSFIFREKCLQFLFTNL